MQLMVRMTAGRLCVVQWLERELCLMKKSFSWWLKLSVLIFEPRVGLEPTTFSLRMKCSTG